MDEDEGGFGNKHIDSQAFFSCSTVFLLLLPFFGSIFAITVVAVFLCLCFVEASESLF